MKRTIISGLVTGLCISMLAGCGGGTSETSDTKLLAQTGCASTYCYGYNVTSSSSIQFYVKSAPWADIHYTVNGGTQSNVRMSKVNGNNAYTVTGLKSGDVVRYFFTVGNTSGGATDTAWMSAKMGSSTPTPTPTPTPTGSGPSGYSFCANEGGGCSFTGTHAVAYGANGMFTYRFREGSVNCNTTTFGDPVPGAAKSCYYNPTVTTPPAGPTPDYIFCGKDDGMCSFSGTRQIAYGASGGPYAYRNATDRIGCNTTNFGDPAPGAHEYCWVAPLSPTPTPTPTPTGAWNGNTTFTLVNNTHGAYADSQVYWAIIGKDWSTGKFVWVNASGQLIPMSTADNGALTKNGQTYTNYFHSLSQSRSVTIPPINSARMFMSIGSPMYIKVNSDINGNIGYAGPDINNPSDPNTNVYFDFIEMAILRPGDPSQGIFANTTRVDQFGFPVLMRVQGLGGFDQTVGETETRSVLMSAFQNEVPSQFKGLGQAPYAPYRIIAPAHATFNNGGANATYLDSYINALWTKYASQTLTFTDQQGTFTGRVVNGQFQFSDGQGTYIVKKPTTAMALLGNGTLNDASGTTPGTPAYDKQLQIQAQLCAAINRHIVEDPAHWYTQSYHYQAGPANYFAKFWHDHGVNKLAYGFAYDDVGNFSPSIHTAAPTTVTVNVGW